MSLSTFARYGTASSLALFPLIALSLNLVSQRPNSSLQALPSENESLVVTTLDDTVGDDGVLSLREAIATANEAPDGTVPLITFADDLGGTLNLSGGEFVLSHDVSIVGNTAKIVLNANSASRFFTVQAGVNASLSLLTLQNGQVVSSRNAPLYGGAIDNRGNLVIESCTLANNKAAAAIYANPSCPPRATNCQRYYTVPSQGGAISNSGSLTVKACTLLGNSSYYGGAIYSGLSSTIAVQNSTFNMNSAQSLGGGICSAGNLTIQNCTITKNSGSSGGGVRVNGTTTIHNSIIVGNTGAPLSSPNITGDYEGSRSPDNIVFGTPAEAGLEVDEQGNAIVKDNGGPTRTIAILDGSAAIDRGDDAYVATGDFDQRGTGYPRIRRARVDAGAFELQSDPTPTPTPTVAPTATPTPTATPLPSGIQVSGQVVSSEPNSLYEASVLVPCSQARVTLQGEGKSLSATTDSAGNYRFYGLTQGTYTVRVQSVDSTGDDNVENASIGIGNTDPLPFVLSQQLKITKKTPVTAQLTLAPFTLYSLWGQVTGKATTKGSTPALVSGARVALSKANSANYPTFTLTAVTNTNGFYLFKYLGRAKFKVGVIASGFTFKDATTNLPGTKRFIKPSQRLDFTGTVPKVRANGNSVSSS